MSNKNNANKDAKTMSELGKNLVISSKNVKKTILPKAVGEEIVIYVYRAKEELDFGDNDFAEFYKMMMGKIDSATYNYIMNEPIQSDRNAHIVNLLNAWINGWEEL